MQILHISDTPNESIPLTEVDSPDKLAHTICKNDATIDLFLINVNYKTNIISRSENSGITLLKFLRLYHFSQHCILYSFLSREQLIQQDSKNLIIFSEGVTFVQMPEDLSSINFDSLVNKKAPEDLSEYFKIGFSTPEENRHDWANWWGIERLWQIHEVVIQKKREDITNYTDSKFRIKMQSLESLTARYLYPINFDKVREAEGIVAIENYNNQILLKRNLIKSRYLSEEEKEKYKQEIEQLNQKMEDVRNRKNDSDLIGEIRGKIINNKRKIVLIDDQADDGWEVAFKNVLYNEKDTLFSNLIAPEINENLTCLHAINDSTDIVLLDLRLNKESGTIHDITELSGVKLLKIIKERHPGIPVIMITASNKFKSYQTLLDLGADGYWMKEGLDSRFSEQESLENYIHLLKLIEKLSGREYRLLKHFATQIKEIKKKTNPWWKEHTWYDGSKTEIILTNKENKYVCKVTELLDYGLMLYTNWLKMFILNENNQNKNVEIYKENLLANIINTLSKTVELIHSEQRRKYIKTLELYEIGAKFTDQGVEVVHSREDYLAFYIYCMRNIGSHISTGNNNISFDFFDIY